MAKKKLVIDETNYDSLRNLVLQFKGTRNATDIKKALNISSTTAWMMGKYEHYTDFREAINSYGSKKQVQAPVAEQPTQTTLSEVYTTPIVTTSNSIDALTEEVRALREQVEQLVALADLEKELANMLVASGATIEVDEETRTTIVDRLRNMWV